MRLTPFEPASTLADDDENTLQTDVMRFMAIIAFCLLVVFIPLAKSLPDMVEPRTEIIEPEVDRDVLVREVTRLQALSSMLIRRVVRLQERLTEMVHERARLAEVEGRLRATEHELAVLEDEVHEKQTRNHLLQERLDRVSRQLREQEQRIERSEALVLPPGALPTAAASPTPAAMVVVPPPASEPTAAPEPTSAPAPPGRQIIRFASHDDLLDLIASGEIELVVHTYGTLFRLDPGRAGLGFELIDRFDVSERTYYMPESNVPLPVLAAFRRHHANLISPSWEFYLKVSPSIEHNLAANLATGQTGAYVIHHDGRVVHEAE